MPPSTPPRAAGKPLADHALTSSQFWATGHAPSIYQSFVHEPGKFSLGQHRVVEIQPTILPNIRLPDAQSFNDPVELLVSVVVLCGPQGVRDAFDAVHDGAGEVIGRVDTGKHQHGACGPVRLGSGSISSNADLKYNSLLVSNFLKTNVF